MHLLKLPPEQGLFENYHAELSLELEFVIAESFVFINVLYVRKGRADKKDSAV